MARRLVIVSGDHGEGLGDHGLGGAGLGHLRTMYQESIRIPLLIYDESDVHYGNLKFATQIDVAPTIADRLGLRIPPSWEGRSLLSPVVKQYSFHRTTPTKHCYGVVDRVEPALYKYITCDFGAPEELDDVMTDPHEEH